MMTGGILNIFLDPLFIYSLHMGLRGAAVATALSNLVSEGLSGGFRAEVEPLGIKVIVVEPGAFRTDFAGRSLMQSEKVMTDYEQTAGARRIGKDICKMGDFPRAGNGWQSW